MSRVKYPAPNKKKNANNTGAEQKKKSSKLLKDLDRGTNLTPVNTDNISSFNAWCGKKNSVTSNQRNINANNQLKGDEIKTPIVIDDDFQAPKIKKISSINDDSNNIVQDNLSKNKPKTKATAKQQRKPKTTLGSSNTYAPLMSTLVAISKNGDVFKAENSNTDIVMTDLIETKEANITDDLQTSTSNNSTRTDAESNMTTKGSAHPPPVNKPKISKKRAVKPKANNDNGLPSSLKTPFKRPRRTEDQSPTDENGVAIPSPKKRMKNNSNKSPTKISNPTTIETNNEDTADTDFIERKKF